MTNLVVTGCRGQLGTAIRKELEHQNNFGEIFPVYLEREDLDLTDEKALESFFVTHSCDAVINCAAYTNVDKAETEPREAERGNIEVARNLARMSAKFNFKLIHVSTDYVFDGLRRRPYKETDGTSPRTIYGKTKEAAEKFITSIAPNSIVVRTAWLYSGSGRNFFLTMRNKALNEEPVKVVNDQTGTPTLASDLAKILIRFSTVRSAKGGIYHYTGDGETTWYEFAREIFIMHNVDPELVTPITTLQLGSKVARPHYSVLDNTKIKQALGISIPHWKVSLSSLVESMT